MMKPAILLLIPIALLVAATGCSKHHSDVFTPPPTGWVVDSSGRYPYSMTAVVTVPDDLCSIFTQKDMMAAFVGTTCRGVGVQQTVGGTTQFYILIRGTASEQSSVYFEFYSSVQGKLYRTSDPVPFAVDSIYGSPDLPDVLYDLNRIYGN